MNSTNLQWTQDKICFYATLACLALFFIFATRLSVGKEAVENNQQPQLSTDLRFDPHSVHGSYQYGGEAIATVEDEKVLEDLLSPREHFKDRIKQDVKRY